MKKGIILFLALIMCISFAACGQTNTINLPFEISDVEEVTLYHFFVPADAEKKILTEQKGIEEIIGFLSEITLKDKKIEKLAGGSTTSFRFNLTDGTSYDVIYSTGAVKSGAINLTNDEMTWFTAADIESLWDNCNVESIKADENELPFVE